MTTTALFKQHTDSIKQQIMQMCVCRSTDTIVARHKKDIIISNKLYRAFKAFDRIVICGWHMDKTKIVRFTL
jgi:hypothetical protein